MDGRLVLVGLRQLFEPFADLFVVVEVSVEARLCGCVGLWREQRQQRGKRVLDVADEAEMNGGAAADLFAA